MDKQRNDIGFSMLYQMILKFKSVRLTAHYKAIIIKTKTRKSVMVNIHEYDTVALDHSDDSLTIIDQTLLPNELKILRL